MIKRNTTAAGHELTIIGKAAEKILCCPSESYAVQEYMIEIIESRLDTFLPLVWVEEGNKSFLVYDRSACISMDDYFSRKSCERADIFRLLSEAVNLLRLCQDHLLDARQAVFDPGNIYLSKQSVSGSGIRDYQLKFMYVPVEGATPEPVPEVETAIIADLAEACIELSQDKELLLESEVNTLRKYVMGDLDRLEGWLIEKSRYPEKPKRQRKVGTRTHRKQATATQKTPERNKMILPQSEKNPQSQIRADASRTKLSTPKMSCLILLDLILLLLLNLTLTMAIRTQNSLYYALTAVGLFILILSDVYLLCCNREKAVSETRFEQERRIEQQRAIELTDKMERTEAAFDAGSAKTRNGEAENYKIAYLYPSIGSEETTEIGIEDFEDLKPAAVMLNREFYIGSDTDRCDFKPMTRDLSPLHARISWQDGSYLLTDLASDSGTYLNHLRLHYYEDYVLYSGALLRFDQASYRFVIEKNQAS